MGMQAITMARARIFLMGRLIFRVEVLVESINQRPVLEEFSLGDSVDIKGQDNPQLEQGGLKMFEIVRVLVFVFGSPSDLGVQHIATIMVNESAVDHTISEVLNFGVVGQVRKQGFEPANDDGFGGHHHAGGPRLGQHA